MIFIVSRPFTVLNEVTLWVVSDDVTVSIFRGGTAGQIATTGVRQGYLAYNLTVPKNSTVEVCQKPKYLAKNDSILVTTSPTNSVGVLVAGKYIT